MKSNPALRRYGDVRELIASPDNPTPLVRINCLGLSGAKCLVKLEWYNPFGSIKDRTAHFLLEGMEQRGELEGKELVEPTSGNTGIALAAIAARMGIPITVTIPDGVPEEKKVLLRLLGAQVWETPDDLCPIDHPKDGAIALAHSMVNSEGGADKYAMPNQYANVDNIRAHYTTTGPEIWQQTDGKITHFFAGYGTCGTLTGTGRFLKEQNPDIQVIAVEPQKGHKLPGLKNLQESRTPEILDTSVIDDVIRVADGPAYDYTFRLIREDALIVGPSTGAIVAAAASVMEGQEGVAVCISPDSGFKYCSYFVPLLAEQGTPTV
jgi:cysteine synthase